MSADEQELLNEMSLFQSFAAGVEQDALLCALDCKEQIECYQTMRNLQHERKLHAEYDEEIDDFRLYTEKKWQELAAAEHAANRAAVAKEMESREEL